MAAKDPSRESHFPAIEKKYGEKMKYWFGVMSKLEGKKYPEQIAHLRENGHADHLPHRLGRLEKSSRAHESVRATSSTR